MKSRIGTGLDARPIPERAVWTLREIANRKQSGDWPIKPSFSTFTYEQAVQRDGPMAWWRFDEPSGQFADQTGTYGTAGSDAGITYLQPGVQGESVLAAGSQEKTVSGAEFNFLSRPFSIECWVKPTGWDGYRRIASYEGANTGWGLFTYTAGSGEAAFAFQFFGANLTWGSNDIFTGMTPAEASNQWFHLVYTFDGVHKHGYMNGRSHVTANQPIMTSSSGPMRLMAGHENYSDRDLQGYLDELVIYDRVLSPRQVADHYWKAYREVWDDGSYVSQVVTSSPLAYWPLNETSGSTADDFSDLAPGTYENVTLGDAPLVEGGGASTRFNGGLDSRVNIPYEKEFAHIPLFTFECWVKMDDANFDGLQTIVDNTGLATANGGWAVWYENRSSQGSPGRLRFFTSDGSSNFALDWEGQETRDALEAGAYLTFVRYNDKLIIFVNGEIKTYAVGAKGPSGSHSYDFYIGGAVNQPANAWSFRGTIEQAAFYNRELRADEIMRHYRAGKGTSITEPQGDTTWALPAGLPEPDLRFCADTIKGHADGDFITDWEPVVDDHGVVPQWIWGLPKYVESDAELNGHPSVDFAWFISGGTIQSPYGDGAQANCRWHNYNNADWQDKEIWIVGHFDKNRVSGSGPYFIRVTDAQDSFRAFTYIHHDGYMSIAANGSWKNKVSAATDGSRVIGMAHDGSNLSIFMNSASSILSTGDDPTYTTRLILGDVYNGSELRLAEILAFPVALDATQRTDLVAALKSRYGIA